MLREQDNFVMIVGKKPMDVNVPNKT